MREVSLLFCIGLVKYWMQVCILYLGIWKKVRRGGLDLGDLHRGINGCKNGRYEVEGWG